VRTKIGLIIFTLIALGSATTLATVGHFQKDAWPRMRNFTSLTDLVGCSLPTD
jgi:hypothetical protein